ncbi:MAG: NAD(P)/FAD-dependent oxidoreductase [Parachlamydiaceae bacterium]
MKYDLVVVGGGAAGFFGAINCAEAQPNLRIAILEKTRQVLSKVKISGGGRCNVTHACFDERELVKNYPRGHKELIGPFTKFKTTDTITWFKKRGINLKTEEDGRMFPTTDTSATIIECFNKEIKKYSIDVLLGMDIRAIERKGQLFSILAGEHTFQSSYLLVATGSHPKGLGIVEQFGHRIISPVPSLFTFNIPDSPLLDLAGITVNPVEISIKGTNLRQKGSLLLTHWGFSGPAALKLSAFGARILHDCLYDTSIIIDWVPDTNTEQLRQLIAELKQQKAQAKVNLEEIASLPKNLLRRFVEMLNLEHTRYASLSKKQTEALISMLKYSLYDVKGKTTYKSEFVTAGGVDLKEVNFKTMESLIAPDLFFAGEILNIDGITGGFNFQNAWTTSWIAAQAIKERFNSQK